MTRLLMPAFVVGIAASTLTGSDVLGTTLMVVTFVVLAVVQRVTGRAAACAIPQADNVRSGSSEHFSSENSESTHAGRSTR